jgi:hypothetical protein
MFDVSKLIARLGCLSGALFGDITALLNEHDGLGIGEAKNYLPQITDYNPVNFRYYGGGTLVDPIVCNEILVHLQLYPVLLGQFNVHESFRDSGDISFDMLLPR